MFSAPRSSSVRRDCNQKAAINDFPSRWLPPHTCLFEQLLILQQPHRHQPFAGIQMRKRDDGEEQEKIEKSETWLSLENNIDLSFEFRNMDRQISPR